MHPGSLGVTSHSARLLEIPLQTTSRCQLVVLGPPLAPPAIYQTASCPVASAVFVALCCRARASCRVASAVFVALCCRARARRVCHETNKYGLVAKPLSRHHSIERRLRSARRASAAAVAVGCREVGIMHCWRARRNPHTGARATGLSGVFFG